MADVRVTSRTRELARVSITAAIKDAARRQLRVDGAAGLSVRAVAREVGVVSSAVYRYFPTRNDLLTALIVDAYDALGSAVENAAGVEQAAGVEAAGVEAAQPRARWQQACRAIRGWAATHPHEYALLFGSPVPGYRAPADTIPPGARVPTALLAIVSGADAAGSLAAIPAAPFPAGLAGQLAEVATVVAPGLPEPLLFRAAIAWTQVFGMVSFELFGQLVGSFEPADQFFDAAVDAMADFIGLR